MRPSSDLEFSFAPMNPQTAANSPVAVHKFGGASVRDAAAIGNLEALLGELCQGQERMVIVVSAMGKTTNALERALELRLSGVPAALAAESVMAAHRLEQRALGLGDEVLDEAFAGLIASEARYESWVSWGEHFSTLLVAAYLRKCGHPVRWADASQLIRTDGGHPEAVVDWPATERRCEALAADLQAEPGWIVTQGFIGGTSLPAGTSAGGERRTTLGREGSDFSGALIARGVKADRLTIWKDVPGMMNADPRIWPDAICLDEVDFADALAMSRAGAGVIHHKTVLPLQAAGLELHVKCFAEPGLPGTVIRKSGQKKYPAPLIAFAEYPEGVREVSILNAEPNEARAIIEKKFPSWSIQASRQEGAMAVLRCRISIRLR